MHFFPLMCFFPFEESTTISAPPLLKSQLYLLLVKLLICSDSPNFQYERMHCYRGGGGYTPLHVFHLSVTRREAAPCQVKRTFLYLKLTSAFLEGFQGPTEAVSAIIQRTGGVI